MCGATHGKIQIPLLLRIFGTGSELGSCPKCMHIAQGNFKPSYLAVLVRFSQLFGLSCNISGRETLQVSLVLRNGVF